MPQLQTLDQKVLARKQIQVFYDIKGEPLYALVPLKRQTSKRSVSEILEENAAEAERQGIKLKDLLLEFKKVRQGLYKKYYA